MPLSQCPSCGESFRGHPPACPECGIELFDSDPDEEDIDRPDNEPVTTLAERITSVLEGTGFRPYADMPPEATHHSGPFFLVTEGVGATVRVAWTDATDAERGAVLRRYEIRLHEVGLDAERRDSYLYVTEREN